jgi:hypothetical protein
MCSKSLALLSFVFGVSILSPTLAEAQSIPCDAGLNLSESLYKRMRREIMDGSLLEAQEVRQTFWEVRKLTSNCPALDDLAQKLMDTNHGPNAKVYTQAEIFQDMFSKAIVGIPSYCFKENRFSCKVIVDGGSSGGATADAPKRRADDPRIIWHRKPN